MFKLRNIMYVMAGVSALTLSSAAFAVDQSVDAEAEFRQALSLTKNTDIDFTTGANVIEFTGTPGVGDTITMGTDTNIAVAGSAFTAPATGQVGDVDIHLQLKSLAQIQLQSLMVQTL